jgi:hypothetical protein
MLDETLELHLRRALVDGAERQPMTLTVADLERGLARRRRERTGRRIAAVAVAAAAVAVVSIVALGSGWLRLPSVAAPRPPAPVASADPAVVGPTRAAWTGQPGDVVVIDPVVGETSGAQAFEVWVWPVDGEARSVDRFSGVIGADVSPNVPSRVSPDGYLAVGLADRDDLEHLGYAIYDLLAPTTDPIILTGLGTNGAAWSPDGRVALIDGDQLTIVEPATGDRTTVEVPADVSPNPAMSSSQYAWTADGSGITAFRSTGATSGEVGVLGLDGTFRADPAPVLFTPLGIDRDHDPEGRWLGTGCRTLFEPTMRAGDCSIGTDHDGRGTLWAELPDDAHAIVAVWDRAYDGAWVLVQRYTSADAAGTPTVVELLHVDRDGTLRTVRSMAFDHPEASDPAILAISSDDARVAVQLRSDLKVIVDTATGDWESVGGGWDQVVGWVAQRGG